MSIDDPSQLSMIELFRMELAGQSEALTADLLALERDPAATEHIGACMRAAHSLKGAARIIDLAPAVSVAHAMEDCLVNAQRGTLRLTHGHVDLLLRGVDLLATIAAARERGDPDPDVAAFLAALDGVPADAMEREPVVPAAPERSPAASADTAPPAPAERFVRMTSDNLDRLLSLAGESLLQARRLRPFADDLFRLRRLHDALGDALDRVRAVLPADASGAPAIGEAEARLAASRDFLARRLEEIREVEQHATDLANRLYDETVASRMLPFADGVRHFSRLVRDLGRSLGKTLHLDIAGGETGIDRDILETIDGALGHLLRNAADHGIEPPADRVAAGKPAEGRIRLEARHVAGRLQVVVEDDGRGVDPAHLRAMIVARGLATEATAASMAEGELLAFLFLPGFSMKPDVSDVSGRGVGLDAVQSSVRAVQGTIKATARPGRGLHFQLELPLTLSVLATIVVDVSGEPFALPLARVDRALAVPESEVVFLNGRAHARNENALVPLVPAARLLGRPGATRNGLRHVVVLSSGGDTCGLVVDRFLGSRDLVVRPLDPRFGKIQDVSATALLDDGSPVLILDVEDIVRSAAKLPPEEETATAGSGTTGPLRRKRVLVVDDSLTVRELERKVLAQHGYEIEVAADGVEGWNMLRSAAFDLVVTDIDMPRMDGLQLVTMIRADRTLAGLPVVIVSYKDREEDRRRGLDAGADHYLAKSGFQDDGLVHVVAELIGGPLAPVDV